MTASLTQSPPTRIAAFIKAKRREGDTGLRAAAKECGLSAATLSRLERGLSGSLPDAESLKRLASWLGTTVSALVDEPPLKRGSKLPTVTTPEIVEVHLRADKKLSPQTARALAQMFRSLYDQVARQSEK